MLNDISVVDFDLDEEDYVYMYNLGSEKAKHFFQRNYQYRICLLILMSVLLRFLGFQIPQMCINLQSQCQKE
mgnify:CR=1 FL=1